MASDSDFVDGIQSMGIVNALKTGDLILDMLIAMCIPLILRSMFSMITGQNLMNVFDRIVGWLFNKGDSEIHYHERIISHIVEKDKYDTFNRIDDDSHNEILIKAITMYLHYLQCTVMRQSNLRLTTLKHSENDGGYYDSDDEEDDDTFAAVLQGYSIVKNPLNDEWHQVGRKYPSQRQSNKKSSKGIPFDSANHMDKEGEKEVDGLYDVEILVNDSEETEEQEEGDDNNKKKFLKERRMQTLRLRSMGEYSIDAFVSEAYTWYVGEVRKSEKDTTRYMFDMKKQMGSDDESKHEFKRYKLSDEKTFDSLFFREKKTIVKLFRHFLDKTGKYGIKGYPQKLGLLLHGPPGTGKTSLIKAVAEYTGRHIVNIPLARIQTNEELSQLFFSGEYHIEGRYYPQKLGFKDVIFVMEDIDAASKVVQRRDGKKTAEIIQTQHVDLPVPKSLWMMLLQSNNDDCKELVKKLMEKSERLKKNALAPETLHSLAKRMASIPGMSLVGYSHENDGVDILGIPDGGKSAVESETIQKIAGDAIESGKRLMENCESVDEYLAFHAKSIKTMLEMDAEIDENFENELLGVSPFCGGGKKTVLARTNTVSQDVSYSKYNDSYLEIETKKSLNHMMGMNEMPTLLTSAAGASPGMGPMIGFGNGGLGVGGDDSSIKGLDGGNMGGIGGGGVFRGNSKGGGFGGLFGGFAAASRDTLNLSGLLNVLDGVVDTPGRILIMTSNHPEKLDPALIRPGRIDKKLNLGYMHGEDVNEMLEHYFQMSLGDTEKKRVCQAVQGDPLSGCPALKLTPAQVEQLTAEHDNIEDMIKAIEEKGAPMAPTQTSSDKNKKERFASSRSFDF